MAFDLPHMETSQKMWLCHLCVLCVLCGEGKESTMIMQSTKVLQRRRDVISLLVRGVSPGEIAEVLKEKRDTIYNDIRVIRSGKHDTLVAHTREEITTQLYLNVQERTRHLWRIVDNPTKEYVKVLALRELRLNDERVLKKLSFMSEEEKRNSEEEEAMKQKVMADYAQLQKRVDLMAKLREGYEAHIKKMDEEGRVIHHYPITDEIRKRYGLPRDQMTWEGPESLSKPEE